MSAFTEANREAFNKLSSSYDSEPWRNEMTQQIKQATLERKDWIGIRWAGPDDLQYGRETRLLDYACGTGSVTKAMGPWVTTIRGIDVSENMVKAFNDMAQNSGLNPKQVHAVVGDLLADEVPAELNTPEYNNFDIAVVGLGFHHFENPVQAVQRLAERLKPETGVLVIIDFLPFNKDAGAHAGTKETIKHGGFARTNMQRVFEAAKFEKFSFSVVEKPVVMKGEDGTSSERTVFFARGRRPPTAWGKFANWFYSVQTNAGDQFSIKPKEAVPESLGPFGGRK